MKKALTTLASVSLILGGLAWGASAVMQPHQATNCGTVADVMWHLDRSRNGVSLTCNHSMISTPAGSAAVSSR